MNRNSTRLGAVATTLATIALVALTLSSGVAWSGGGHSSRTNGGTLTCCSK